MGVQEPGHGGIVQELSDSHVGVRRPAENCILAIIGKWVKKENPSKKGILKAYRRRKK
jgi:hypothetical protein